jgi:phage/plasmid primase-like uncharacterized protein
MGEVISLLSIGNGSAAIAQAFAVALIDQKLMVIKDRDFTHAAASGQFVAN